MSNRANGQHGGVLAFVLIGVLLTALLAGGIFLSKRQGRAAVTGEPTAVNTPAESTDTTKQAEPQKPAETTKKDTPQQTTPETPAPTPKPTTPSTTDTTPTPSAVATTGPSDIATTGPTDTLFTVVALSGITAAVSAYRISVQRMRLAALK